MLIERYLFRQLLVPTLLALAAMTMIAFLSQSLSALDLVVDQRQGLGLLLEVTLLALPQLIALILPIAVFVAAAIALNRLHSEHEIVVCFAGGMSRWRVISPTMRLAVAATLISLALGLWVGPLASQAMRAVLFTAQADVAASFVQPGQFGQPAAGLTVFAQGVSPEGEFTNLFVHQQRDAASTTFNAQTGRIAERDGKPLLVMRHGSSQELNTRGVLNFLSFDEYALDLSPFMPKRTAMRLKTSDRYLHELLFPDLTQSIERRYRLKMLAEGHSRIASPLYNIAMMAIVLAAVIGGPFSRMGYARRIGAAGAAAAAARLLGFAAQALAIHEPWLNVLQYAFPLIATGLSFAVLFGRPDERRQGARASPLTMAARP
jgi:lipopolysaccharide export system permease protein